MRPLAGLLAVVLAALTGIGVYTAVQRHHAAPARSVAATASAGTVARVLQRGGRTALLLRAAGGRLSTVRLGAGQLVTTNDGVGLSPTSIRVGDKVRTLKTGSLEDTSQEVTDVQGVVAAPPDINDQALVLSVAHSSSVLIDAAAATAFQDPSGETSSLNQIEQADLLRVHGVLDAALGEMTQIDSVVRLGPLARRGSSVSKGA